MPIDESDVNVLVISVGSIVRAVVSIDDTEVVIVVGSEVDVAVILDEVVVTQCVDVVVVVVKAVVVGD